MNADSYSDIPREARKWAALCHAVALVGLVGNGIGFLLGPLVVWLIKKEDHPFIDEQGKEALKGLRSSVRAWQPASLGVGSRRRLFP